MSIFNEFNKKEKPFFTGITRGLGGLGFGGGGGGGGDVQASVKASGGQIIQTDAAIFHVFVNPAPTAINNNPNSFLEDSWQDNFYKETFSFSRALN